MLQKQISLLAIVIFGMIIMGVGCSLFNKNTTPFQPSKTTNLVEIGAPQNKPSPSQKVFDSLKLGVTFTYGENEVGGNGKIKVSEIDNKIYVYPVACDYTRGQSVEVFNKDPKLTFEEAVKNKFLSGYDPKECFVKILGPDDYPRSGSQDMAAYPNFTFATIAFPLNTTNDSLPWWENGSKCPPEYSLTNAVNFFVMDKNIPGKYLFVKLGQEMVASDGNVIGSTNQLHTWFYSLRLK